MRETTVEKQTAAVVANDGAIEGALAELDTKLAAWLAAMREGQAALLEVGTPAACASEESRPPEAAAAADSDQKPSGAGRRGSKLFQGQVPRVPATRCDHQMSKTPALPPVDETALSKDDEALLASLDAETAGAIQIKRRLTGNKRSVRELLEEIQSEPTPVRDSDLDRRRWWRRNDERDDG
jgi:hypothetical protein